jgi:hypothetical protein
VRIDFDFAASLSKAVPGETWLERKSGIADGSIHLAEELRWRCANDLVAALKDVSSKADAQEAYTQALVAIWNEEDKTECGKYNALMCEADEHVAQLRTLTDHHHISALKDSKGKLAIKTIKERPAATGDKAERATLNKYIEADKQQKVKTREAAELLAAVESHYRQRLKADPLPKELADLQATVRYQRRIVKPFKAAPDDVPSGKLAENEPTQEAAKAAGRLDSNSRSQPNPGKLLSEKPKRDEDFLKRFWPYVERWQP